MNSRGYQKSTRTPPYPDIPLPPPHRNAPDNYYTESTRNYNTSREFHTGIFTSELSKRDRKKEPELALEIQEVPDYSAIKARTSSKRTTFGRESRDEYYRQSELNSENADAPSRHELHTLKAEIYQSVAEMMKEQGVRYDKALVQLVSQINTALKKSEENYLTVRKDANHIQEEFGKLNSHFQIFSKESEEKLETLVNEVATLGGSKKSKAYGDYGMDLKNSFQGLNSSISVNLGNQSSNSKLVNEVIYQLDSLKKDISENKFQIEEMSLKINSNIREPANTSSVQPESIPKEDLFAAIDKRIREEKRSWKIQEKIEAFEIRLNAINDNLHKTEMNLFQMNEETKNTFNNQMIPKIKKIEGSIVDIYSKIDSTMLENQLRSAIAQEMEERLKDTRLLKVRNCTKTESSRIGSISGMNEDRLTSRQTYLLDEENYLLDSQGSYLLEEWGGQRRRVRVEEGELYLLGLKGMQIGGC